MHPFLNTATKAARAASNIITRGYARLDLLKVTKKGPQDFVSNIDKKAEEVIIHTLSSAYPQHSILSEEVGAIKHDEEYQWIIDPLDGTRNFIHGLPHFSVSIALKHRGHIEHAVVYHPMLDLLFTASRGAGAQLNNRRIRVAEATRLSDCILSTGFPPSATPLLKQYQDALASISTECLHLRQMGSAALDLAYTAAGFIDGDWEPGLSPWDVAAGSLLVKEAGGLVSDFNGGDDYLESGNIVVGNAKILKQLLKHIQPFFKSK